MFSLPVKVSDAAEVFKLLVLVLLTVLVIDLSRYLSRGRAITSRSTSCLNVIPAVLMPVFKRQFGDA